MVFNVSHEKIGPRLKIKVLWRVLAFFCVVEQKMNSADPTEMGL